MLNTAKLAALQKKLAKKVILRDMFPKKIKLIGGADEAFFEDKIISAIVICDARMRVVEKVHAILRVSFPYIPTFLSFREGPAILKAFAKLKHKPDILLINGCGRNHPRFCGLASHVGVLLNIPTIGVTQNLLCGEVKRGKIFFERKNVGYKYRKVFIAPGNKVSTRSALRIAKRCMRAHKLPEPLALAHIYAGEIKRQRLAS